jgi:hypothetical protein
MKVSLRIDRKSLILLLDKRSSDLTADASERVVIDDEMLKRCPGVDKLRADTRDKLKTYLQEQVIMKDRP